MGKMHVKETLEVSLYIYIYTYIYIYYHRICFVIVFKSKKWVFNCVHLGPLTTMDKTTKTYTLVGVVSFGIGCGRDHFPGVYGRVTSSLKWIKNVISDSHCNRN